MQISVLIAGSRFGLQEFYFPGGRVITLEEQAKTHRGTGRPEGSNLTMYDSCVLFLQKNQQPVMQRLTAGRCNRNVNVMMGQNLLLLPLFL
jgi:hypothetical protein